MTAYLAYVRKLIVYIVAVSGGSVTAASLPQPYDVIVPAVIGVGGAVLHYFTKNGPKPIQAAPAPAVPPAS